MDRGQGASGEKEGEPRCVRARRASRREVPPGQTEPRADLQHARLAGSASLAARTAASRTDSSSLCTERSACRGCGDAKQQRSQRYCKGLLSMEMGPRHMARAWRGTCTLDRTSLSASTALVSDTATCVGHV